MTRRRAQARYHVTVTEHVGGQPTTVMHAWGSGLHAIVGDITTPARLQADHGKGGPPHLLEHLADLIAANPAYTRANSILSRLSTTAAWSDSLCSRGSCR
jgi:hypothetical protein